MSYQYGADGPSGYGFDSGDYAPAESAAGVSLGGQSKRRESPAAQAAMLELALQQEAEARDMREVQEIIAALFAFEGVF